MNKYLSALKQELKNLPGRATLTTAFTAKRAKDSKGSTLPSTSQEISSKKCQTRRAVKWVDENLKKFKKAGFTDEDLFRENLPKGLIHALPNRSDLKLELIDGEVIISWESPQGGIIKQRCKPELRIWRGDT